MVEGDLPAPTALVTMIPGGYKAEEGKINRVPSGAGAAPRVSRPRFNQYIEPPAATWTSPRNPSSAGRARHPAAGQPQAGRGAGGRAGWRRLRLASGRGPGLAADLAPGRQVRQVGQAQAYLALGISGAPEHVEGMRDAECIIGRQYRREGPDLRRRPLRRDGRRAEADAGAHQRRSSRRRVAEHASRADPGPGRLPGVAEPLRLPGLPALRAHAPGPAGRTLQPTGGERIKALLVFVFAQRRLFRFPRPGAGSLLHLLGIPAPAPDDRAGDPRRHLPRFRYCPSWGPSGRCCWSRT